MVEISPSRRIAQSAWTARLGTLKLWLLLGLVLLSLGLSGCVQSDLAIRIKGQAGGEIYQSIHLSGPAQPTLSQFQRQARHLGGSSKLQGPNSLEIRIPFDRSEELASKLNQLLQPLGNQVQTLPAIPIQAQVNEQNWLLFIRGRLDLDLDLRGFGVSAAASPNSVVLSSKELVALTISLETPWGSRPSQSQAADFAPSLNNPHVQKQGSRLTWQLEPGYGNHLEAVYLYPSPVGWGSVAILGLVAGAWYWRYRPRHPAPDVIQNSQ